MVAPVETNRVERARHELLDRVRHARRDDVVARLVVLEHQPHRAHVVARIAPVAAGGEVPEDELAFQAERDRRRRAGDLPGEEVDGPERRLVVVEDPAAREHPVAAAIGRRDEVRVRLRDAVGRHGARWRLLGLGRLARLAEDLARGRLVEADRRVDFSDRLQHRRHADRRELGRPDRLVPGARDEGGGGEVVDLGRPCRLERLDERGAVEEVGPHELDPALERSQRVGVRGRLAADDACHRIPLFEQERGEKRAVLAADAGDQRAPTADHGSDRTAWAIVPTSGSRSNPSPSISSRKARPTPGYAVP